MNASLSVFGILDAGDQLRAPHNPLRRRRSTVRQAVPAASFVCRRHSQHGATNPGAARATAFGIAVVWIYLSITVGTDQVVPGSLVEVKSVCRIRCLEPPCELSVGHVSMP